MDTLILNNLFSIVYMNNIRRDLTVLISAKQNFVAHLLPLWIINYILNGANISNNMGRVLAAGWAMTKILGKCYQLPTQ